MLNEQSRLRGQWEHCLPQGLRFTTALLNYANALATRTAIPFAASGRSRWHASAPAAAAAPLPVQAQVSCAGSRTAAAPRAFSGGACPLSNLTMAAALLLVLNRTPQLGCASVPICTNPYPRTPSHKNAQVRRPSSAAWSRTAAGGSTAAAGGAARHTSAAAAALGAAAAGSTRTTWLLLTTLTDLRCYQ